MHFTRSEGNSSTQGSCIVVTKSMSKTPFGTKLIYKADGECIWSEYVSLAKPSRSRTGSADAKPNLGFAAFLWAGFRTAWSAKAT